MTKQAGQYIVLSSAEIRPRDRDLGSIRQHGEGRGMAFPLDEDGIVSGGLRKN